MNRHTEQFSVATGCRVLKVSRGGFYAWRRRQTQPALRQQRRVALDQRVSEVFQAQRRRYGSPRLTVELSAQGYRYDRKTVARSLQRQGLRAKAARRFKVTTDSTHHRPVAPNHLAQHFDASAPNQKWVGDITYLWSPEGWLYLATLIDLYSRAVVGWAISERMTADWVCDALRMAWFRRGRPRHVLVHSDRGSPYCSAQYQALLGQFDLLCSMSGKGNCFDNACAESFFHSLKIEAIHGERFASRDELRQAVFQYIEIDYNRFRRHSAIRYLSPMAFEDQFVA
jgi:transposase InsO family protein